MTTHSQDFIEQEQDGRDQMRLMGARPKNFAKKAMAKKMSFKKKKIQRSPDGANLLTIANDAWLKRKKEQK